MNVQAPARVETTMTSLRSSAAQLWPGTVVALAVAAGWFLLAVAHPTTTYHFDPFLVAIAPFVILRLQRAATPWRMVLASTGFGAALALAETLLLDNAGALRGPAVLGIIGPMPESLISILPGILAVVVVHTLIRQARSAH